MESCRHLADLRKTRQKVSNMAAGAHRMDDEVDGRWYKKNWVNLQIIFWAEKHLRFGNPYWPEHGDFWPGINEGTKYVLSNTLKKSDWKNTSFIKPWKISKSSKIQKVLIFRFGAAVNSLSCYLKMILWTNSGSKFTH